VPLLPLWSPFVSLFAGLVVVSVVCYLQIERAATIRRATEACRRVVVAMAASPDRTGRRFVRNGSSKPL
jgi:hypothetical protein